MSIKKLILDTDIGDDIDDAYALAMALSLPEIELIGVTTVFKNTDARARIASKILKLANHNCPVYAGLSVTEAGGEEDEIPIQYTSDLDEACYAPLNDTSSDRGQGAVDFIVRSAETYGSDLTLVAIGALSNVAAAIRQKPESMKKIGQIVLMGGDFVRQLQEWNILCNPSAAKTVLESGLNITCVGLNITEQTNIGNANFQHILEQVNHTDPLTAYLAQLTNLWHKCIYYEGCIPILHDSLTLYQAFYQDMTKLGHCRIHVETENRYAKGMTFNIDHLYRTHEYTEDTNYVHVVTEAQAGKFVEWFMEKLFRRQKMHEVLVADSATVEKVSENEDQKNGNG